MEKYKISIIVPVYNVEKYLEYGIKSLIGQTYRNLEILLIDDGSRDRSGEICDRLALEDSRIRVFHKENGGVISAWSKGVREATGDYLNFMDSDDWVDLNMMEEMAAQLTGAREIISSDYVIERDDGRRQFVYQKMAPGEYDKEAMKEKLYSYLFGEEFRYVFVSRCMKLISRELIENNICWCDPRVGMGDDTLIIAPALLDCERLVIMDHKAYYHYRFVHSSIVHRYDTKLFQNMKWLRTAIDKIIEGKYPPEEQVQMRICADREYVLMLLLVLKNEVRGNPNYQKSICSICEEAEIRDIVRRTPVKVESSANRLLYAVLKHPNALLIRILCLAMRIYDAR